VNQSTTQQENFSERCQKVLQVAKQLYKSKPDWVTFFRETLGVSGSARSVFSDQEDYARFEQSREFQEIQKMMGGLRTRKSASGKNEVTKVITVRLPESLHEALKAEASDHQTSMNKLCISKLLQVLNEEEKAEKEEEEKEEEKQAAQDASTQPSMPPMISTPLQPSPSAQAVAPPQRPSFRSSYGQPTAAPTERIG